MNCIFVKEAEGGSGYTSFFDTGGIYFMTSRGEYAVSKQLGRGRQVRIKSLPVEARRAIRKLEAGEE